MNSMKKPLHCLAAAFLLAARLNLFPVNAADSTDQTRAQASDDANGTALKGYDYNDGISVFGVALGNQEFKGFRTDLLEGVPYAVLGAGSGPFGAEIQIVDG